MPSPVPDSRIRALNARPLNRRGDFVLYWMIAARRTRFNFALQRAVELSIDTGAPLVVLEGLNTDYAWANDRLHRFVLDGMAANQAAFSRSRARYYPYVEPSLHAGRGVVSALAAKACAVVTDYMSSESARRKMKIKEFLAKYGG